MSRVVCLRCVVCGIRVILLLTSPRRVRLVDLSQLSERRDLTHSYVSEPWAAANSLLSSRYAHCIVSRTAWHLRNDPPPRAPTIPALFIRP